MAQLGMFLIHIVVWATEQLSRSKSGPVDVLMLGLAHVAMAGVRITGTIVDHLLPTWDPDATRPMAVVRQ